MLGTGLRPLEKEGARICHTIVSTGDPAKIMEFISTRNCMRTIVQAMGTVDAEQLIRFFRNANDAGSVEYYIKEFIAAKIFDYDRAKNHVTFHGTPAFKDFVISVRIMAFWIIAYFGYERVREVIPIQNRSQLLLITESNETYELTVCITKQDVSAAAVLRRLYQIRGQEDDVNHIAVVRSHDIGAIALDYGFDSYCIYDEDYIPQYFTRGPDAVEGPEGPGDCDDRTQTDDGSEEDVPTTEGPKEGSAEAKDLSPDEDDSGSEGDTQ